MLKSCRGVQKGERKKGSIETGQGKIKAVMGTVKIWALLYCVGLMCFWVPCSPVYIPCSEELDWGRSPTEPTSFGKKADDISRGGVGPSPWRLALGINSPAEPFVCLLPPCRSFCFSLTLYSFQKPQNLTTLNSLQYLFCLLRLLQYLFHLIGLHACFIPQFSLLPRDTSVPIPHLQGTTVFFYFFCWITIPVL